LFFCIYRITDLVVLLLAVIQFVLLLVNGEPSRSLVRFSDSLGQYVQQIIRYLGWRSNQKPYPFEQWPEARDGSDSDLKPR
jgi:hypothetical protein